MSKNLYLIALIVILVLLGGVLLKDRISTSNNPKDRLPQVSIAQPGDINTFKECVASGFPVSESYPASCRTESGILFIQDIGNELELQDLIRIDNPRPNQKIQSPLQIRGEARGTWYFEAGFPIRVEDGEGNILGRGNAEAMENWMTEEFVKFTLELEFEYPRTESGNLILEKANPSGLPENEKFLTVPVEFAI